MSFALQSRTISKQARRQAPAAASRRLCVHLVARSTKTDERPTIQPTGYISEDNSGKGNVYPRTQQPFFNSPSSQKVASQGLGGAAGGAVLVGLIGLVAAASFAFVGGQGPETLDTVADNFSGDTLTTIADRIAATL